MLAFPELLEVNRAPEKARRWHEQVREYVWERQRRGEIGQLTAAHAVRDLDRFPEMFRRSGVKDPPYTAALVQPEHVLAYRGSSVWSLTTKRPALSQLKGLLAKQGSPLALERSIWRLPRGRPTRRHWVTRNQLAEIYDEARGRERVHVALQGFNGLRECELLRLRWQDVQLTGEVPTLAVLGKGRDGGKPRTIPCTPTTRVVLEDWRPRSTSSLVYGVGHSAAHVELASLGRRLELPVPLSGHVLRRSFGRIAYQAGVPLVDIRNVYGHESIEMTTYYIGVDQDAMAAGLARFDSFVRHVPIPGQGA